MALPLSRNATYTEASPPRSADLNDIQDQIKRLAFGDYEVPRVWRWHQGRLVGTVQVFTADAINGDQHWQLQGGIGTYVYLPCAGLRAGHVISRVGFRGTTSAAPGASINVQFWRRTGGSTNPIAIGSTMTITNSSESANPPSQAVAPYRITDADEVYAITFGQGALYHIAASIARPPP